MQEGLLVTDMEWAIFNFDVLKTKYFCHSIGKNKTKHKLYSTTLGMHLNNCDLHNLAHSPDIRSSHHLFNGRPRPFCVNYSREGAKIGGLEVVFDGSLV